MADMEKSQDEVVLSSKDTSVELKTQLESEPTPQRKVESFETANGSEYSYDETGRTVRHKTVTGERFEKQDLTVFAKLDHFGAQKILRAYRKQGEPERGVDIIEEAHDGKVEIVRSLEEIIDPSRLFIGVHVDGQVVAMYPASLYPEIGDSVYDTRAYQAEGMDDDKWRVERHLGNEVTKINYKD